MDARLAAPDSAATGIEDGPMSETTRRAIEESIRRMRQTVLRMHEEIEAATTAADSGATESTAGRQTPTASTDRG